MQPIGTEFWRIGGGMYTRCCVFLLDHRAIIAIKSSPVRTILIQNLLDFNRVWWVSSCYAHKQSLNSVGLPLRQIDAFSTYIEFLCQIAKMSSKKCLNAKMSNLTTKKFCLMKVFTRQYDIFYMSFLQHYIFRFHSYIMLIDIFAIWHFLLEIFPRCRFLSTF